MLGDLHLMMQTDVGGDHNVVISPGVTSARRARSPSTWACTTRTSSPTSSASSSRVSGEAFVAEPLRVLAPGTASIAEIEEVSPGVIRATGEDSLVALFESASGVLAQLAFVPSGPGHHWLQRSVHGRAGR